MRRKVVVISVADGMRFRILFIQAVFRFGETFGMSSGRSTGSAGDHGQCVGRMPLESTGCALMSEGNGFRPRETTRMANNEEAVP